MPSVAPLILVFDSGLGGLTVFREIVKLIPAARYAYLADDAGFPYGPRADADVIERVCAVLGQAIDRLRPDCVVIACNTASTLVLPPLRARYTLPFVGTVPAVKPAARLSVTRRIAVLATPGTVSRDYTRDLVERFAKGCEVHLVGSARLAAFAESELAADPPADAEILAEIMPCFRQEGGAATDVVALACTHFPLLLDRLTRLAPWPVTWLDPAPAIARRVADLLGNPAPVSVAEGLAADAFFTSGRSPEPARLEALARFGLRVRQLAEAS
jgi:glutamate racemase